MKVGSLRTNLISHQMWKVTSSRELRVITLLQISREELISLAVSVPGTTPESNAIRDRGITASV